MAHRTRRRLVKAMARERLRSLQWLWREIHKEEDDDTWHDYSTDNLPEDEDEL